MKFHSRGYPAHTFESKSNHFSIRQAINLLEEYAKFLGDDGVILFFDGEDNRLLADVSDLVFRTKAHHETLAKETK